MNEIEVVLQRHEQQIKTFERDMTDMKTVQAEGIRKWPSGRPAHAKESDIKYKGMVLLPPLFNAP